MAQYRYIFADLLTNATLAEFPLTGVTFDRMLNKAGNFQGFFALGNENYDDQMILDSTLPGRTSLYVERTNLAGDVSIVWGGVLWSRLWQEQSKTFQFNGQTFESFLYMEDIRTSLLYFFADQRNILRDLITKMQAYPYRNIGIVLPPSFTNNILRSVTFNNYEVWTFGSAAEYMVGFDQGFDYSIDCQYDSSGNIIKVLRTDDILGTPASVTQLVFDYPGNISNFWVPENAANAATSVVGVGAGEGSAMIRTVDTNQQLLDAGYPELVQIYTNKDVSVPTTLASQTRANLLQLTVPVSVPTFEVNPEMRPEFGTYQMGDYAIFDIESVRYPHGKRLTSRIMGWSVTPTSSSSQEGVKLVILGESQ